MLTESNGAECSTQRLTFIIFKKDQPKIKADRILQE